MPAWPLSNDRALLAALTEQAPKNLVIRTQMDIGPAKTRRRGSAGVREVSVEFAITLSGLAVFLDWFDNNIGSGAESFDFTDPFTETLRAYRFSGDPAYTIKPITTDTVSLTATWEKMP